MSLYGQYIKERLGKEIVENENGFATYYYVDDGVYIEDIFVIKEARKSNVASKLADEIADIAKNKGVKKMYGTVVPTATGSEVSLKVLMAYGFKPHSAQTNLIVMVKEI